MNAWEYKTRYISIRENAEGEPDYERLHRFLNFEGAKGWEIINVSFCGNAEKCKHRFWIYMRRQSKSGLEPYFDRGYSDDQLSALHLGINDRHGKSLSSEDVDYFLNRMENVTDWTHEQFSGYCFDIRRGVDREKAFEDNKNNEAPN